MSGLYATAEVTQAQRQQAETLLSAVGIALWVEEETQIDAVTAVSGSGPAYFFLLIEAMTAAGVKLGLSQEVAKQLAEQTALAPRAWPPKAPSMPPSCVVASRPLRAPLKPRSSRSRRTVSKRW